MCLGNAAAHDSQLSEPLAFKDAQLVAASEEFDNLDADEDGIMEAEELREFCALERSRFGKFSFLWGIVGGCSNSACSVLSAVCSLL